MADDPKAPIPAAQEGGPGTETGGVDVTKTVKIKMSGKEFEVAPELASAYEAREQEFQRKVSENSGELGTLRKYKQEVEPVLTQLRSSPQGQSTGTNLNVLWYENPEAAAKVVEDRVSQRLTAQYQQAESIKAFWDGFYSENKDLAEDKFVVKAVFSEKYGELAPLSIREAQTKLADATRDELLRISRKMKSENTTLNRSGELEEASGERAPKPTAAELEDRNAPKTLSEVIASRRQARRQVKTTQK
jgi:hypothetical protein